MQSLCIEGLISQQTALNVFSSDDSVFIRCLLDYFHLKEEKRQTYSVVCLSQMYTVFLTSDLM